MERQRFEDSWKEAFKDAEMSPSESLWTNIELDLEKAEGKKMKKRVLYFKLLAAASVAFAMTFAGIGYLYISNQQNNLNGLIAESNNQTSSQQAAQSREGQVESTTNSDASVTTKTNSAVETLASQKANAGRTVNPDAREGFLAQQNNNRAHQPRSESGEQQTRSSSNQKSNDGTAGKRNTNVIAGNTGNGIDNSPRTSTVADHSGKGELTDITKSNAPDGNNKDRTFHNSNGMFNNSNSVAGVNAKAPTEEQSANSPQLAMAEDERMFANAKLPEIVHLRKPAYQPAQENAVDPVKQMLDRLAAEEQKYASNKETKDEKNKKTKGNEKLWTSLGVAAGSFNTMVSQAGSNNIGAQFEQLSFASSSGRSSLKEDIVREQSRASGVTYAVGLALGGKISRRWVLQGGLSYMAQSSDYVTNGIVSSNNYLDLKAASISEISNAAKSSQLLNVAQYNVNTNLKFVNVPLQAGYLIVDRSFGLQLNAGVSTDVFLQSTLTPDAGMIEEVSNNGEVKQYQLQSSTQGAGEDSPYRTLNFSGLISTELSYRIGQHYRVAINPGIRYPFSSIYKSEIAVDAMPLTFDVGLRFRYIFN